MNKTIIALAVALATTAANAATVFQNEQTEVELKGEVDAYLSTYEIEYDDAAIEDETVDPDIDTWAQIQLDVQHQMNNITLFTSFEMENGTGYGLDNGTNEVNADEVYLGASFGNNFGFAVGEIGDFGDSLDAITIDKTNEGFGYMDDFATSFESDGHALSLKYNANGLEFIADTYMSQDEDYDPAYGLSATYSIADFDLGASYQDRGNRDAVDNTNDGDNSTYGLKLGYSTTDFSIAANYVTEEIDSEELQVIGLAADYKVDALRLYTSVFDGENDETNDEFSGYTLGIDYEFSGHLTGFVEYSSLEDNEWAEGVDATMAIVGAYMTF